jgi:superfamily II DNA or RNA helicase
LHRFQELEKETRPTIEVGTKDPASLVSNGGPNGEGTHRAERGRPGAEGRFELDAPYTPMGDQSAAIASLCRGVDEGRKFMTLKGATGTGKTFMVANVVAHAQRPTLVLAPNKV